MCNAKIALAFPLFKLNLELETKINYICAHLYNVLEITFFSYNKIFADGTTLRLSNNTEWSKIYFTEEYYNDVGFYKYHFERVPHNSEKAFLWIAQPAISMYCALQKFNIGNGMSIYRKRSNYTEIFCFATSLEKKNVNNIYFNHFDYLKKFSTLFSKEFLNLFAEIDYRKLIKSNIIPSSYFYKNDKETSLLYDSFLREINLNKKPK